MCFASSFNRINGYLNTAICAILFMVTSLGLAIMYTRSRTGTVMDSLPLADEFSVSDVPAPVSDQAVPEQTPAEK